MKLTRASAEIKATSDVFLVGVVSVLFVMNLEKALKFG